MLNLKIKKGFTLIEVLLSMSLFAMLFSAALSIKLSELKVEKWNSECNKNLAYLEGLKVVMANNFSYSDVLSLKNGNKIYINKDNMKYDLLEVSDVKSVFTDVKPISNPYIVLNIQGENVLDVTIEFYSLVNNKEDVYFAKFYKGMYKR